MDKKYSIALLVGLGLLLGIGGWYLVASRKHGELYQKCANAKIATIHLSHGNCFGKCQSYLVDVNSQREVHWWGLGNVKQVGKQSLTISQSTFLKILQAFDEADFMTNPYKGYAGEDAQTNSISLQCDDFSKKIMYEGEKDPKVPKNLVKLDERIISLAQVQSFIQ